MFDLVDDLLLIGIPVWSGKIDQGGGGRGE